MNELRSLNLTSRGEGEMPRAAGSLFRLKKKRKLNYKKNIIIFFKLDSGGTFL